MKVAHSADSVARDIADDILAGTLPTGLRLPSERELALQYGVGRPLIREALRSLAEMGLVQTHAARGTFVRDADRLHAHRPLELAYRRRGGTARQLQEARMMLEIHAAGLAAERATAEEINDLGARLQTLERSEGLEHVRYDIAYHLAIAAAAHNPLIETMFGSIAGLTVALMLRSLGDPNVFWRAEPYHRIMFEAIQRHDPEASRTAMRDHLNVAGETYGPDYDRSVDGLARRTLRLFGAHLTLDEFVAQLVPDGVSLSGR